MYYRQRVKLEDVRVDVEGQSARAEVHLRHEDRSYVGRARNEGKAIDEPRLAAEATLAAAETLVGGQMTFTIDTIQDLQARESRILLLTAYLRSGEQTVPLIGTCRIADDAKTAAARAALDAINRFVDLHLANVASDGSRAVVS
jgi:hypothetical protein